MIRAIRTGIGPVRASALLESAAPISADVERKLFYPFHWFLLRSSTRTLLGESALRVSCLVDGRTGLCATADPFVLEDVRPSRDDILDAKLGELEACRIAERYVAFVARRRQKALVSPGLELLQTRLVHKPFWVLGCREGSGPSFRMLVDGVTGGFHPLPASAFVVDNEAAVLS